MDQDPADQRVDGDGDQGKELDLNASKGRRVGNSLEHPKEGCCQEIDHLSKWIGRIGGHQFEQEAQTDETVQNGRASCRERVYGPV